MHRRWKTTVLSYENTNTNTNGFAADGSKIQYFATAWSIWSPQKSDVTISLTLNGSEICQNLEK
jgi:hypothetical protein